MAFSVLLCLILSTNILRHLPRLRPSLPHHYIHKLNSLLVNSIGVLELLSLNHKFSSPRICVFYDIFYSKFRVLSKLAPQFPQMNTSCHTTGYKFGWQELYSRCV